MARKPNTAGEIESPDIITSVDQVNDNNFMSDAVFDFLLKIQDIDIRHKKIEQITELAVRNRKKGAFADRLAAYEKLEQKIRRSGKIQNKTHFFEKDSNHEELNCGQWIADFKGVRKIEIARGGGEYEVIASPVPLYISKEFMNLQTSTEKVELMFFRHNVWRSFITNKNTIASSTKIVNLADKGLPVTSERSRNMVNYLDDIMNLNDDSIESIQSTSKLGWIRDVHKKQVTDKVPAIDKKGEIKKDEEGNTVYDKRPSFSPYRSGGIVFDSESEFKDVFNAVDTRRGNYFEWRDLICKIRDSGRIEPIIMMAASAASVLIEPLNLNPFIVHLSGETEGGKTVCLLLAASIWANPNQDAGFIGNFKTTQVALEIKDDLLNNLPMILDDTAEISEKLKDNFSTLIYVLCSGKGKSRSNADLGLRYETSWKNIALTTGEHPIVDDNSQGGALNRVVSIPVGHEKIFKEGRDVVRIVKNNYGWAGPEIVKTIRNKGFDYYNKRFSEIYDEIKESGKMEKQASAAAVLILGDELLCEAVGIEGHELTQDQISGFLRSENQISEELRCYNYVISECTSNQSLFYTTDFDDELKDKPVWGKIEDGYFTILPSKLKKLVKENGCAWKSFISWADQNELLKKDKDNRLTHKARIIRDGGNNQTNCYSLAFGTERAKALLDIDIENVGNETENGEKSKKGRKHFIPLKHEKH